MDEKKKHSGLTDSVIGATTAENIERYGSAASEFIKGYKGDMNKPQKQTVELIDCPYLVYNGYGYMQVCACTQRQVKRTCPQT